MRYVYILRSVHHPGQRYFGITSDLRQRLSYHNDGRCVHTSKFRPWRIETYVGFSDERLMVATTIRYLRLAINAPIEGSEILTAHALAKQLATKSSGDVSARFLVRAVELIQGVPSARADIEKMLGQAREAKADRFAEEVEKFLRAHPAAK